MAFAAAVPLIAAGIGAAGSVAGGLISQGGNKAAGGISQQAAQTAQTAGNTALTQAGVQSGQDRSLLSPWTQVGAGAANQVSQLLGLGSLLPSGDANGTLYLNSGNAQQDQQNALARFQTDPGYQFRLQQGVNAIDRSGAARGTLLSGAQQKALSDYGQNTGSAEYGNYFNRLAAQSGQGLTAANYSNTASNQIMNTGINDAFQGGLAGTGLQAQGAGYGVAGQNAFGAGVVGAANSAASGLTASAPYLNSLFNGNPAQPSPMAPQGNPYYA